MELTVIQALERGIAAHRAGNLQEAERIYNAILQSQPNHPDANHNLGVLAVSVSKVDAAIPLFKKAVEANPKVEQFWLSYVDALIKLNQIDNAREVLRQGKTNGLSGDKVTSLEERLSETSNDSTSLQSAKDQLIELYKQGNFKEALEKGKPLLNRFPDDLTILSILAGSYFSQEKYEAAVEYYDAVIHLKPEIAEFYLNCGVAIENLLKPDEALSYLRKSIILKPSFAEAFYNVGNISSDDQDNENAIRYYKRALIEKPNYLLAIHALAKEFDYIQNLKFSLKHHKKSIILDPRPFDIMSYQCLGKCLLDLKHLVSSRNWLQYAIPVNPAVADTYNTLEKSGPI